MTKALDYFDPAQAYQGDLSATLKNSKSAYLVLSFTSDWRFSPGRSREIVKALLDNNLDVTYADITCSHGHDSFLMFDQHYHDIMRAYMNNISI